MTWAEALRHADAQIARWKRDGIGPGEAMVALHDEVPGRWQIVRQQMAAWAMLYRDKWED